MKKARNLLALDEYDLATRINNEVTNPKTAINNFETVPKSKTNPVISRASYM